METERREIHFAGRVQGVGFRYTTKRLATGFDVSGSVKNLPNGEVLMVVEGKRAELDAFVEAIRDSMQGNIDDTRTTSGAAQQEFTGFEIIR